jgi:N-acetylglucosamine-6-phosphate deacetylase
MRGIRARLWLDGEFRPGFLMWQRGKFSKVKIGDPPARLAAKIEDLGRTRVIPGFVDTLCHGFGGVGAPSGSADELLQMTKGLAAAGVTTALMGFYPSDLPSMRQAAKRWDAWKKLNRRGATRIFGWHMEGPFLPKSMAGALPPKTLRSPSRASAEALIRAGGGWLKMCTMAPEISGAVAAAEVFAKAKVWTSVGHTEATLADCLALQEVGPVVMTHFGNRMPPLTAREPGPMGFAMTGSAKAVGVIPDGQHVCPETLKLWANTPALESSLMFQSDNLSHAGTPAKSFSAGGKRLHRAGPAARDSKGGLGGTLDSLPELLAARIADGTLTWAQAIRGGCEVPGALLGNRGQLKVGMLADFVVLDKSLRTKV